MNFQEIKQLIKVVEKSTIGEIEIEENGLKIRISKNSSHSSAPLQMSVPAEVNQVAQPVAAIPSPFEGVGVPVEEQPEPKLSENITEVKSPMVGTFYRAPAPDADPYVEVGDIVKAGDTLCIIEAMKLMNEIQSEVSGKIVKIMVENAQPVEFEHVLFQIEKS